MAGRYINQDPIGLEGGVNIYSYTTTPLILIDPIGKRGFIPASSRPNNAREAAGFHDMKGEFMCLQ